MQCSHSSAKLFSICPECGCLKSPALHLAPNHFELLDIKIAFHIDESQLTQNFYSLSKRLHPDRFQLGSSENLDTATIWFAQVAKAYEALKDPETRALYLLNLAGLVDASNKPAPPPLAMEYLEILEEPENHEALSAFKARLTQRLEQIAQMQDELFWSWEESGCPLRSCEPLRKISALRAERSYLESLRKDLEHRQWD